MWMEPAVGRSWPVSRLENDPQLAVHRTDETGNLARLNGQGFDVHHRLSINHFLQIAEFNHGDFVPLQVCTINNSISGN